MVDSHGEGPIGPGHEVLNEFDVLVKDTHFRELLGLRKLRGIFFHLAISDFSIFPHILDVMWQWL